jgi:hypothetical protein
MANRELEEFEDSDQAPRSRGKSTVGERWTWVYIWTALGAATYSFIEGGHWQVWIVWPLVLGLLALVVCLLRVLVESSKRTEDGWGWPIIHDWRGYKPRWYAPWLAIVVVIYAILWVGGSMSFGYTHHCVRSHVEVTSGEGDTARVCDWYAANSKRWTLLDPLRQISHWWQ